MRKFLSRRDRHRSVASSTANGPDAQSDSSTFNDLTSVQEDSTSNFGNSGRLSKRASVIADSFGLFKAEDIEPHTADDSPRKRSILRTISSRRSSSTLNQRQDPVLVDPNWDSSVIKVGWLNLLPETGEPKLSVAELKGSTLYVYKPPQEVSHIASFIPGESEAPASVEPANDQQALLKQLQSADPSTTSLPGTESSEKEVKKKPSFSSNASTFTDMSKSIDNIHGLDTSVSTIGDRIMSTSSLRSAILQERGTLDPSPKEHNNRKRKQRHSQHRKFDVESLFYTSAICPHPQLVIDDTDGSILGGSLESICHTIAFYPSHDVSDQLISILAMITDIRQPLAYFQRFLEVFIGDHLDTIPDDQIAIPFQAWRLLIKRVKRVIKTIATQYVGMLLEESIMTSIWNVMLALDKISDCGDLKLLIHEHQKSLRLLLQFEDPKKAKPESTLDATAFLEYPVESLCYEIRALDSKFADAWNPRTDKSLCLAKVHDNYDYWRRNFLVFDSNYLHYLSRSIAFTLFEDTLTKGDSKKRAQVLEHWINTGDALYKAGDMVGWLGIASFICSVPVLRLSKTWPLVDPKLVDTVAKRWSPIVYESQITSKPLSFQILAPLGIGKVYAKEDVIPYIYSTPSEPLSRDFVKQFTTYSQKSSAISDKWDTFLTGIENSDVIVPTKTHAGSVDSSLAEKLRGLVNASVYAQEPFSLQDAMDLSLKLEKVYSGQFYRYHDKSRSPLFLGSYASILFPRILDSYEIYDRSSLVGAIGGVDAVQSVLDSSASNLSNLMKADSDKMSSKKANRNTFLKHIRDVFNIDTYEFHETDERIIFKTIMDAEDKRDSKRASKSRPSSILFGENTTTKRFSSYSTSSFNLDEYAAYHNYLKGPVDNEDVDTPKNVSAWKRASLADKTVPILPEAATVDRLIDLLVLTSSVFSSRVREKDIKGYCEKTSAGRSLSLKMDQGTFTMTFFAVYRCFLSPRRLIKGLQKRFVGAKSCSLSITKTGKDLSDLLFPDWTLATTESDEINYVYVLQIQLGVLESLLVLFEYYYTHFQDDVELRQLLNEFLYDINDEIDNKWPALIDHIVSDLQDKNSITSAYNNLVSVNKQLEGMYLKNCYSPLLNSLSVRVLAGTRTLPTGSIIPPYSKVGTLEEFAVRIDASVGSLMNDITAEDWIDTFEILEVLTSRSPLSLFNYDVQPSNTSDSLLVISNMYHWISTLVDEDSDEEQFSFVVDKLPVSVRAVFHYYFRLKNLFTKQLLDSSITPLQRRQSMASLLRLLVICRIKMHKVALFNPSPEGPEISPRVPSLIESCLINTILSPESRLFSYDWIQAAKLVNPKQEALDANSGLSDLLPPEDSVQITGSTHLTPCAGWILQSLLEIACFIPNMYVKNTSLINFDKDRFAYNCVVNIMELVPVANQSLAQTYSYLLDVDIEPIDIASTYQLMLTEMEKGGYERTSLFGKHLSDQRKMMKLEEAKKSLLLKQVKRSGKLPSTKHTVSVRPKSINAGIESLSGTTIQSSDSSTRGNASSKNSRFKLSGLFGKSKGFGFSGNSHEDVEAEPVPASELPVATLPEHRSRPLYTLTLKEASIFPTYGTPYSFKIDIGNGSQEVSFQATNDREKDDWMRVINHSQRHWFYSRVLNRPSMGASTKMVFGVPIEYVCLRENSSVPNIIEKFLSEIEYRGLDEVGIYRKSASLSAIQKIREKINLMGDFNMEDQLVFDVHNLTGCVKLYLRELPDPLIPDADLERFVQVKQLSNDDRRFDVYREIFDELPVYNYNMLERLLRHLKLVVEYQDRNRMTSSNLATILGGSLIEGCDPENLRNYFGLMTFVCEDLILHYHQVFKSS